MKVFCSPLININKNISKKAHLAFSSAKLERSPSNDIFESNIVQVLDADNRKINARILKKVNLRDKEGKDIKAILLQHKDDPEIFAIYLDSEFGYQKPLCKMFMHKENDCMYVDSVLAFNEADKIKGAGTELMKFAVQASIKNGFDGKVKLFAIASLPFYFKNNFRLEKSFLSAEKDAYLSYITRNQTGLDKAFPAFWCDRELELTEKAACALLNGDRLYENNLYETQYNKILEYKNKSKEHCAKIVDIDFCETTDSYLENNNKREFVIQIVQKTCSQIYPLAALKMSIVEDYDGIKASIDNISFNDDEIALRGGNLHKKIMDELLKTAEDKAEKLNAVLTGDTIYDRKRA